MNVMNLDCLTIYYCQSSIITKYIKQYTENNNMIYIIYKIPTIIHIVIYAILFGNYFLTLIIKKKLCIK